MKPEPRTDVAMNKPQVIQVEFIEDQGGYLPVMSERNLCVLGGQLPCSDADGKALCARHKIQLKHAGKTWVVCVRSEPKETT